jgi:hypothetical protein
MRAMARRARGDGGASTAPGNGAAAQAGRDAAPRRCADDAALAQRAAAADRGVEQRKFLRDHWMRSYLDSPGG